MIYCISGKVSKAEEHFKGWLRVRIPSENYGFQFSKKNSKNHFFQYKKVINRYFFIQISYKT